MTYRAGRGCIEIESLIGVGREIPCPAFQRMLVGIVRSLESAPEHRKAGTPLWTWLTTTSRSCSRTSSAPIGQRARWLIGACSVDNLGCGIAGGGAGGRAKSCVHPVFRGSREKGTVLWYHRAGAPIRRRWFTSFRYTCKNRTHVLWRPTLWRSVAGTPWWHVT